ncbi:MAG: segregation and condensation protein A [Gaiellales bacterium]
MVEARAVVSFDSSGRRETVTQVRLEAFEGPLGLMLSLIEARRLDVLTVALGDLAGAFLEALAVLPGDRLPHISAFVGVASQLILIKSRALLPNPAATPDAPIDAVADPEAELRRRLIVYRIYRDAGLLLGARLEGGHVLFHREAAIAAAAGLAGARAADAESLDPGLLVAALADSVRLLPPEPSAPPIVARTLTLAERAEAIRSALRSAPEIILQALLVGIHDRVVLAVTFLALLELVKRREVMVEQDAPWGPIRCRLLGRTSDAAGAAAVPIDESLADFA